MKKACFIVPFFGKFPNYFDLFLKSIEMNPEFDWLFFTDDTNYTFPPNTKVYEMSFDQIKELFQSKIDFNISLEAPYKICDYRCAFGYLFKEYISEYEFWGYCDVDLVFGRIGKFIQDADYIKCDKIGHLGHFSLYRNSPEINMVFMFDQSYKTVFTNPQNFIFDEWHEHSINKLLLKNNKKINYLNSWADVYPYSSYFNLVRLDLKKNEYITENKVRLFKWDNGRIFSVDAGNSEEFMYVHFQKRSMEYRDLKNADVYYCVPDRFLCESEWNEKKYFRESIMRKLFDSKYIKHRFKAIKYNTKESIANLVRGKQ
jgi:hypothetical protein